MTPRVNPWRPSADEGRVYGLISRRLRRARSEERGFTLIELMSAVFVLSIGVISLITTFDNSRGLISFSEQKETAIHAAEQELERLQGLTYAQVALSGNPPAGSAVTDLGYYASPSPWYRWDQDRAPAEANPTPRCSSAGEPVTNCERVVVDATTPGQVTPSVTQVTTQKPGGGPRLTLHLQRFVTWVDDNCAVVAPGGAAPLCTPATASDYKRITVEVKLVTSSGSRLDGGPRAPLVIGTVVRDVERP